MNARNAIRRKVQRPLPLAVAPHRSSGDYKDDNARHRVTGEDLGEFFKDSNGKLWRYEKRGFIDVEQRAYTDAYDGMSTPWYTLGATEMNAKSRINAWIEDNIPDTSEETPSPTKPSAPKPSSGSGSSLPKKIANAMTPSTEKKQPTVWGYLALVAAPASGFLFAGPWGAAGGLAIGLAALAASRQ